MISIATRLLIDEVTSYLVANQRSGALTRNDVILENIANLEGNASNDLTNKIIASVVNIEEESTLKNQSAYVRNGSGAYTFIEPPVHINLYLLFCTTFESGGTDAYETALHRLSLIIQFFQTRKVFTTANSPFSSIASGGSISEEIKDELRLSMELHTLSFEQVNHLWGSLGGKQVPFVMYKVRLVKIQHVITKEVPLIEQIDEILEGTKNQS